ncbi:aspartic peptidase domain-containing protein [Chiua virens]|nr:aspartic peptidase domain-containing protein [Chiua virens]
MGTLKTSGTSRNSPVTDIGAHTNRMHFTLSRALVNLAILAAAAAASPAGQTNSIAIPISKRSGLLNADKSVNFDALNSHVSSVKAKILRGLENFERNTGTIHPSALEGRRKHGAGVPLTDINHEEGWYGTIEVGTPPKRFTVLLDTGSSTSFIAEAQCGPSCDNHTRWDHKSSSTSRDLHKNFTLTYGGGSSVSGELYTDDVTVAGFTACNQTLLAAEVYSTGLNKSRFPPDGLMGMAFQYISAYNSSPVFPSLVSQGKVEDPRFAFKLSPSGAELHIGGVNHHLYTGNITYTPVTQKAYWRVMMDSVQVNGRQVLGNVDSIIDTGTTLIIGHMLDVSALYSTVGGTYIGKGFYTFPCNSFPSFSLTFNGTHKSFPIVASALNLGPVSNGSSDCVSGLVGMEVARESSYPLSL